MISRLCALGAFTVAAPAAVGCASLVTSSLPLIAAGLGIAALLGAVGGPRQHGFCHLLCSLRAAWKTFQAAAGVYGMAALSRAVLANPSSIPAAMQGYSSTICASARVIARITPFLMTIVLAFSAIGLAIWAGANARAVLLGA